MLPTGCASIPTIEVVIAGGVVRGSDGGIVGEAAVDFIRQFKVDYAVIGASAIDHDGALLDFDFREVKVAQAIIANARHVILVSDSTKFERTAPVRIGHLSQVDTFITDRCDIPSIRKHLPGSRGRADRNSALIAGLSHEFDCTQCISFDIRYFVRNNRDMLSQ